MRLLSAYADDGANGHPQRLRVGEGLIGQCAADKRRLLITELPTYAVPIGSALFKVVPRNIIVLPVLFENQVKAVIELASVTKFTTLQTMFLEQLTDSIGIVLNSIEATMQTEGLLTQSQQLAGELQTQQSELQQTNEQLEQKAQQLAERNVEVERKNQEIEQARRALEEKASELALTSKYKSEFLANMSHELRTPLNSILILGQQLSDNPDGNLTPKQVEFSRTIHGAGTDLLNLISDILDLSKIESGTVTVDAQEVFVSNLIDAIARPFRHEADNRQLSFDVEIDHAPRPQHDDRLQAPAAGAEEPAVQRLQVHRAGRRAAVGDRGRRRLEPRASGAQPVARRHRFRSVRHRHRHPAGEAEDHLRGVPAGRRLHQPQVRRHRPGPRHQPRACEPARRRNPAAQHARQGLDLRALPAGEVCRARHPCSTAPATAARALAQTPAALTAQLPDRPVEHIPDDRLEIQPGDTILLIVEDDPHYARVIMDLARDKGFKVLVATRGADALDLAKQFQPTAVSLDVFLPDMLGWTVLSQLKQNPLTRHIPVQIITLDEDRQHALARGAFSFVTKPTTTEGVDAALSRIKEYAAPRRKRLLVVEDNEAEQMSIRELLGYDDIEIVTTGTGEGALSILRDKPCDCVVLDLRLPDMTGFDVLERIREDASLSEVPVVVFTGRELSAEEDAQLHTMARSIVVKGVELPERLLDETSLFLHRIVTELPQEKQRMLDRLTSSDEDLVGRKVLLVDDDARNIFALSQRAGAPRHAGADRDHRPRGHRAARIHLRCRHRPDGHHDAGNGRLSRPWA